MRSLIKRVSSLEEAKQHREEVNCIFFNLVGESNEDILAYIGQDKSYYKREEEDYNTFAARVESATPAGIHFYSASYE